MSELDALLAGIVADPLEETRWLVLADWLEENDDPRRGELLRLHRRMIATCCEPDSHPERSAWQARMVELLVDGVRPCVPQETLILPGGVPMVIALIPPGEFLMGSENGEANEKPVHRVAIARGFFMGMHPVTQAQWQAVMGTDPSHFKGAGRPVEEVSWDDCQEFCEKLSRLTGRRVGLPTEAQWESACRAGTTTDYHTGDGEAALRSVGWYRGTSEKQTLPVGQLGPNAWGLFDTHGNVWEWCETEYASYPGGDEKNNDVNVNLNGKSCVLRGGSWSNKPEHCRAAMRIWFAPASCYILYGFRVCFRLD